MSFLLLLAVADDAIGLGIIAIGYPDPNHPTQWSQLTWLIPGMATAWGLRRWQVQNWVPYIFIGGGFAWWALFTAHLHPALALIFIVPFLPGPSRDKGLYQHIEGSPKDSPLESFEHDLKRVVDFGLFFCALANAGVAFGEVNGLSWIILGSLIAGKTIGITAFSLGAHVIGFRLPPGMTAGHVIVTSVVAGLGLTVALFISGQAFTDPVLQGAARMGPSSLSQQPVWLWSRETSFVLKKRQRIWPNHSQCYLNRNESLSKLPHRSLSTTEPGRKNISAGLFHGCCVLKRVDDGCSVIHAAWSFILLQPNSTWYSELISSLTAACDSAVTPLLPK